MSMTAPGCGMGDVLREDAIARVKAVPGVTKSTSSCLGPALGHEPYVRRCPTAARLLTRNTRCSRLASHRPSSSGPDQSRTINGQRQTDRDQEKREHHEGLDRSRLVHR